MPEPAMSGLQEGPVAAGGDWPGRVITYRHGVMVRVTHWINVVCMTVLLMSGLQVFNAHPALYWGSLSDFDHPAFAIQAVRGDDGSTHGRMTVAGLTIPTTGVLGLFHRPDGDLVRAFPPWITLPSYYSLADGRRWHFLFAWLFVANGLVYLSGLLVTGRLWRSLLPRLSDLRHLPAELAAHARLRFPQGEAARRYNVLQQLTYLLVIFGLLPLIVLAGCAMSPTLDAGFHWLPELFGGRQSARTVHFITAWLLVAFVLVHVAMVIASGPINNLRSMLTGRYVILTGRGRP